MNKNFLLLQYLLYMNQQIGLDFHHIGENSCAYLNASNIRSSNRVCNISMPTLDDIVAVKSFFGEKRFTWVFDAQDTASENILKNHLVYINSFPAMKLNLDTFTYKIENNLTVEEIALNSNQLLEWISIVGKTFAVPESELYKLLKDFIQQITLDNLKLYLGYYEKKPVAASMIIKHQDIVSIHWVSTLPEFRSKGFGTVITAKPLYYAKENGCTLAILLTSALGKSIYKKIGFQEYALYKVYGN